MNDINDKRKEDISLLEKRNQKMRRYRLFYDLISLPLGLLSLVNIWLSFERIFYADESIGVIYGVLNILLSVLFLVLITIHVFFTRKKINQRINVNQQSIDDFKNFLETENQ
jgi:tellurite resistance protein TehA-like permease